MRLQEIPAHYLGASHQVVDLTADAIDLASELRLGDGVQQRYGWSEAASLDLGPGSAVLALLGPASDTHADPAALEPVLTRMQPGARAVLLCGWAIEEIPYHRLLGPLSAGHCQVVAAVPLERTSIGAAAHSALIVDRVEKLAPPRAFLTEVGAEQDVWGDDADEFASVLRAVNECVLADFVTRPLRRRAVEIESATELKRQLVGRENRVRQLEERLAQAERKLSTVESSSTYQVGRAIVDGLRHPARAAVTVPRDLTRVWREHRSHRKQTPGPTITG